MLEMWKHLFIYLFIIDWAIQFVTKMDQNLVIYLK